MGSITDQDIIERFEKLQIELDLLKNVLIQRLLDREPEETRIDPSDRPLAIGDKVRIANDIKQHQSTRPDIPRPQPPKHQAPSYSAPQPQPIAQHTQAPKHGRAERPQNIRNAFTSQITF